MTNDGRESYYCYMNSISIFLYVISVVAWWASFNYAAARASTARRRKLFSAAAALALAWPFAFIALAAALATKAAANLMIAIGEHINNTWDAAVSDEDSDTNTAASGETRTALADNMPLMPPPPPPATDEAEHDTPTRDNTGDDAETTETADNDDSADDETVIIQKVALSDIL